MTLNELYRAAKTALEPVTEDPTFEAACLLEHFCGANRTELLLHGDKPAESEAEQAVLSALEKRKTGEPLQYLLGEWDFMSLTLSCGEGVLIPREDTAVLVEAVCKRLSKTENLPKGLDLCAGTGAVGLSIAKEAHAEVTEVELYDGAFNYLNENLARYPELPVTAVKGDILDKAFAETLPDGFDFIASNPPYIETSELPLLQREVQKEPKTALDGGADGLDFYRLLTAHYRDALRPGGWLVLEIGCAQAADVLALGAANGWVNGSCRKDYGSNDRAVLLQKPEKSC